ncbi:MAG TPA: hypothetical protein VIY49_26670 [Bryobacteraceae bacterium]
MRNVLDPLVAEADAMRFLMSDTNGDGWDDGRSSASTDSPQRNREAGRDTDGPEYPLRPVCLLGNPTPV